MDKLVTVKQECEVTKADASGKDLIVSLGGDHTYLVASGLIEDKKTPLLGINTNKEIFTGALYSNYVDFKQRKKQVRDMLVACEDDDRLIYYKRSRIHFEMEQTDPNGDTT